MRSRALLSVLSVATLGLSAGALGAYAQGTYGAEPIPGVRNGGSRNIAVQFHIPRDRESNTADWNGHQWGLPNVSNAQDWDNGPEGSPAQKKVS